MHSNAERLQDGARDSGDESVRAAAADKSDRVSTPAAGVREPEPEAAR